MKTVRVFDIQHDHINDKNPTPCDGKAFLHLGEFNSTGNNSYHDWIVDGEDEGGGYVTDKEKEDINIWLKKAGAKSGEKLLIYVWW